MGNERRRQATTLVTQSSTPRHRALKLNEATPRTLSTRGHIYLQQQLHDLCVCVDVPHHRLHVVVQLEAATEVDRLSRSERLQHEIGRDRAVLVASNTQQR